MDFYRIQRIPIQIIKGSRPAIIFFVFIKITLRGPIDEASGMVHNLKFIDAAFFQLRKKELIFFSFFDFARQLSSFFKNKFKGLYAGLEISFGQNQLLLNGPKLQGRIKKEIFISENSKQYLRSVELTFQNLSFANAHKWLRNQNKKSRDEILTAFSLETSLFLTLKIEYPEWQGWEIYSSHGSSRN
jgi:hypothetical protein